MTKDEIKNLLHLAFELEGLLQLGLGHAPDPELDACIAAKAALIAETASKDLSDSPRDDRKQADDMFYSIDSEPEPTRESFTETEPESEPEPETSAAPSAGSVNDACRPEAEMESIEPEAPAKASPARPASRPVFSINDRFRFRRELFGGSDAGFNSALDTLATMETLDEAENFFYSDMEWDPENPAVKEFMAIVARYFKKTLY